MKTIAKYGYIYNIEHFSIDTYHIDATDPTTGYTVRFTIQNLRLPNECKDCWRGQVEDYKLDDYGSDYHTFINQLFADYYEFEDERVDWVIDNCMHEFAKWFDVINKV